MAHPTLEKILAAIPHRPPMLLLDEIVSQDAESIVCRKRFSGEEFFFQGHYPDQPIVPGVILCECGAQAGAVMLSGIMTGEEGMVPVITRMNDVKFKKMVQHGSKVRFSDYSMLKLALGSIYNTRFQQNPFFVGKLLV